MNSRPTDRLPKKAKELIDALPIAERKQIIIALAKNWDGLVTEHVKIHGNNLYIGEDMFRLKTRV